jgi:hypothetical protein
MTDFIPAEKGVPIRNPSTANLQIDSNDRLTNPTLSTGMTSGQFQISRPANILNGFFTRVSPTEVALDWRIPNVGPTEDTSDASNNLVQVDISDGIITTYSTILPTGLYTCEEVIRYWCADASAQSGKVFTPSLVGGVLCEIACNDASGTGLGAGVLWRFSGGPSVNKLMGNIGFPVLAGLGANPFAFVKYAQVNDSLGIYLNKWKYLDFVSPELTNQQDVKDGSTSAFFVRDSLFRWFLGTTTDSPPPRDNLGFVIYPTYKTFYVRRNLAFPKHIKWEANIPVGNLSFEVWATRWVAQSVLLPSTWNTILARNDYSWQMTLQASEV